MIGPGSYPGPEQPWNPASLLLNGHRVSFPGLTCPVLEVDHLRPSSNEVKNEWIYTSICIQGVHRDYMTFK